MPFSIALADCLSKFDFWVAYPKRFSVSTKYKYTHKASFPARPQIECQNGSYALLIIRKLRLEKGLIHAQLAHMAGISIRTLQQIERGAPASPKALKCIAFIRETDFENLWTEQEMPNAEQPKFPGLLAKEKEAMEYVSGSRHSTCISLSLPLCSLPFRS